MFNRKGMFMALKFRKKIRVFPGFSLNLSKTGMSATLGVRGCSVNIGNNVVVGIDAHYPEEISLREDKLKKIGKYLNSPTKKSLIFFIIFIIFFIIIISFLLLRKISGA